MKKRSVLLVLMLSSFFLQGCITDIVTVPVKIAYKTTKGVVKGTAKVVSAVIPDGDDDKKTADAEK